MSAWTCTVRGVFFTLHTGANVHFLMKVKYFSVTSNCFSFCCLEWSCSFILLLGERIKIMASQLQEVAVRVPMLMPLWCGCYPLVYAHCFSMLPKKSELHTVEATCWPLGDTNVTFGGTVHFSLTISTTPKPGIHHSFILKIPTSVFKEISIIRLSLSKTIMI